MQQETQGREGKKKKESDGGVQATESEVMCNRGRTEAERP